MALYRMGFSEPWELSSIVATLVFDLDGPDTPLESPRYGRIISADVDPSLVGREVEIRSRSAADRIPLSERPVVCAAVEDATTEYGWRAIGFGRLTEPPRQLLRPDRRP